MPYTQFDKCVFFCIRIYIKIIDKADYKTSHHYHKMEEIVIGIALLQYQDDCMKRSRSRRQNKCRNNKYACSQQCHSYKKVPTPYKTGRSTNKTVYKGISESRNNAIKPVNNRRSVSSFDTDSQKHSLTTHKTDTIQSSISDFVEPKKKSVPSPKNTPVTAQTSNCDNFSNTVQRGEIGTTVCNDKTYRAIESVSYNNREDKEKYASAVKTNNIEMFTPTVQINTIDESTSIMSTSTVQKDSTEKSTTTIKINELGKPLSIVKNDAENFVSTLIIEDIKKPSPSVQNADVETSTDSVQKETEQSASSVKTDEIEKPASTIKANENENRTPKLQTDSTENKLHNAQSKSSVIQIKHTGKSAFAFKPCVTEKSISAIKIGGTDNQPTSVQRSPKDDSALCIKTNAKGNTVIDVKLTAKNYDGRLAKDSKYTFNRFKTGYLKDSAPEHDLSDTIGISATVGPDSTTIGPDSTPIRPDSIPIGPDSTTIGPDSTTIGHTDKGYLTQLVQTDEHRNFNKINNIKGSKVSISKETLDSTFVYSAATFQETNENNTLLVFSRYH
ncbi:uncharacterized protein LOC132756327 [Ruditapes philippinarum]|uniref:uncharacterized protein LOC132756327 n=1 Tax=Ruditapes philippinarum TaxID=129788 RepID=UPI00295A5CE9|nr:uncharacterized protein LOC132756327 [Ruditapes philippinarum]